MLYDYAVFLGRIQPCHKAHLKIINHALVHANKVIVVLGSHRSAPNVKNPWTDAERSSMLLSCLDEEDRERVTCVAVRDYPYNDNVWLSEVHAKVTRQIEKALPPGKAKVALIGFKKDESSYYLDLFHQWDFIDTGTFSKGVSATEIRLSYFFETCLADFDISLGEKYKVFADLFYTCSTAKWRDQVPPPVREYLEQWQKTEKYRSLQADYKYLLTYKAKWENTPFPVTFTTVDCCIIKDGHVLVVRRGMNPGKGLIALPGGFINQKEWIIDAALRELKEETRIKIPPQEMKKYLKDTQIFDNPDRSLRGRVITHCFYFELPSGGDLPTVKGADDAEEAFWMPLGDLGIKENEFFEDHLSIIQSFIWK